MTRQKPVRIGRVVGAVLKRTNTTRTKTMSRFPIARTSRLRKVHTTTTTHIPGTTTMMMKTTMNHFQRVRQPHHHHHCEVAHPPPSCRVVSRGHDVPPPHSPLPELIFQDTTDSMVQDTATVLLPQFDRHVSPLGGCIGCRVVSRHVRGRITHTRLINGAGCFRRQQT
jgi:hypothetical protein